MPRRSSRTPDKPKDFYEEALSQAERVRLNRLVEEQPENLELLIKGIGMLVRAVSNKYKLSHKAEEDLYQSLLGVLKGVGSVLLPEGFDGQ